MGPEPGKSGGKNGDIFTVAQNSKSYQSLLKTSKRVRCAAVSNSLADFLRMVSDNALVVLYLLNMFIKKDRCHCHSSLDPSSQ